MKSADIAALAASLAAGAITASAIEDEYGHSILGAVLGGAGGLGAGAVAGGVTKFVLEETGIGDVLDDVLGIF
jgi:ribosomal protein S5